MAGRDGLGNFVGRFERARRLDCCASLLFFGAWVLLELFRWVLVVYAGDLESDADYLVPLAVCLSVYLQKTAINFFVVIFYFCNSFVQWNKCICSFE